ncbi:hypothetical protein QY97_00046 [Bacillus thermotolerans]|uniref:Uncharacterized protein n=1 Tax=Bacillus thermotolerans TaxID=1221996 RepID=A0A0F5I0F5_BACTR|nr:hypothetical protein QY97_00046 [Bacillus thermotolerans]KKB42764.1 hypothetical protein QY95_03785 [Bacillus thermotolerans]
MLQQPACAAKVLTPAGAIPKDERKLMKSLLLRGLFFFQY